MKTESIPLGWQLTTLGDIAKKEYGLVDGPFGSNLPASEYVLLGVPVIRGSNLSLGGVSFKGGEFVYVSEKTAKRLERSLCVPEDIVFTKKGTLGQTGFVPTTHRYKKFLISSNQMKLSVDRKVADPRFVYYYVSSPTSREKIIRDSEVTGVPKTNLAYLRTFPIVLPPLAEQKAIAHILGTLDDKIELNQQMNQTLEAIARALFKSWFIDFDPVRAKLDGRQPAGMDAETAALFPAEFEDGRAIGKIPKGWKVQIIGDVIEFAYGKPLKQPDRQHGIVPVYGSNGQIGWHNKSLVKAPGIVIGRKGNPGTVVWTPIDFYPIDTTFYAIPISSTKSLHYLFHALCLQDLPSLAADSAVPGLNRNLAYMNKLLIPSEECLEAFDSIVNGISAKVHITNQEAITLTSIRDALLPKLLSGEIRVQDAEKVVEAVT